MASQKFSITLPERLAAEARAGAERNSTSVSAWMARAVEAESRREAGLVAVEEYEAEHGAFTPAELARARAELAEDDARMFSAAKKSS